MIQPAQPQPPLVIYGAGGHGQVVAETARALGLQVLGFLDDADPPLGEPPPADSPHATPAAADPPDPTPAGESAEAFVDAPPPPAGPAAPRLHADDPRLTRAEFHVAIGDNAARHRLLRQLLEQGRTLRNLIHPHATVSPSARLGRGVFVGPQAVVHTAARLGDGVVVNSAAVVEHHAQLGDAVHVAPTAALAGNVRVGPLTLIGLGAKVLPNLKIGRHCTVAAGAVVVASAPDHATLRGVPARSV